MNKEELMKQVAAARGRRSLPEAVARANGWPMDCTRIVARMDGSRVAFKDWLAEVHQAEDAEIARLMALVEKADA